MDEHDQNISDISSSQSAQSQSISSQKRTKDLLIGIGIGSLITILLVIALYFIFFAKKDNQNQAQKIAVIEPTIQPTIPTNPSDLSFSDPHLKGMNFRYDPSVWEVTELTRNKNIDTGKHRYGGTGILLKEKKSNGSLLLAYNLGFGVGGALKLIKKEDVIHVNGGLSRVKFDTAYIYGYDNDDTHIDFKKLPDKLKEAIEECDSSKKSGMYLVFSEEACTDIASGKVVGYLTYPQFPRSIKLKVLSNLKEIDSSWENNNYIKQTGIDDGYVILETEYIGNTPTEADEIISQIATQ
jgi:hypothetical protein